MSSSNFIVSYLRTHNKKSFQNFLNVCSQDIIRTSPLSCTSIDTLHGHWFSQFLITLKDYNLVMYNSLHPELKRKKARRSQDLEDYWIKILQEREKWQHLVLLREERNTLLTHLDILNREIDRIQHSFEIPSFFENSSDSDNFSLNDVPSPEPETAPVILKQKLHSTESSERVLRPRKPPPPPSERSIYVVNTPPRRRRKKNRINHQIHRSISVSSFNSISSPPHIPNPSSPTQHESPLSSYDPPSRPILHQQSQQQQHHLQSSPNSPSNSSTLSSIPSPNHFPPQLTPESVCNKTCPLHCTK
ncbi:hypothetical protein RCL_jg28560.t1 [Rhizophagus clarus]|uniref:Uncharacterized protein n=1 Tax=Rhizophagus clarus TaxID=94130 RepID=A0A8H3QWT4_9GLOM|nr:hypothetical protein RCL_jg28560.t1 [Rhizophagus clarus]